MLKYKGNLGGSKKTPFDAKDSAYWVLYPCLEVSTNILRELLTNRQILYLNDHALYV